MVKVGEEEPLVFAQAVSIRSIDRVQVMAKEAVVVEVEE